MTDSTFGEEALGIGSLVASGIGIVIAQIDPGLGGPLLSILTQFGGLGLAVWLVYYHTTITIPNMQKEHRSEREAAIKEFKEELDVKRIEYLASIKELSHEFTLELESRRQEVATILNQLKKT